MKKCVKCERDIFEQTEICPYCSAKQNISLDENEIKITEKTEEKTKAKVILAKSSLQKDKQKTEEQEKQIHQEKTEETPEDKNISENEQITMEPPIQYCSNCGAKLRESGRFCWKCGEPISQKSKASETADTRKENNEKIDTVINNIADIGTGIGEKITEAGEKIKQNPKGIMKIYCLLMAISYGSLALHDIQYITSYYHNTIWGLLMVLSGGWMAFLFAVIGLRCQKEYGKNLFYGLAAGAVVKSVLYIYSIYENSKYYINTSSDVYAIIGIVIAVSICYCIMKKNDFITFGKDDTAVQVLRELPWALSQTLNGKNENRERPQKKENETKVTVDINLPQGKLQSMLSSKAFLIFAIIYTANLAANVFTAFSLYKLFFQTLPILFCIGMWMVYCERYKERMSTSGFSLIKVVFGFELVLRVILLVIVVIIALLVGSDAGVALFFLGAIIVGFDIGYWRSLNLTIGSMSECAVHGTGYVEMHASWYAILIWIFQTIIKVVGLGIACYLQSLANNMNMTLNQYGEEVNEIVGYFTGELGLGYGLGYGTSSNMVNSLLSPVTTWIQNTLGFSQSPAVMLLAIAVPVCSIILFFKIRSYD